MGVSSGSTSSLVELGGVGAGRRVEFFPLENADSGSVELGAQLRVPAAILLANEGVDIFAEVVERLLRGEAVESRFFVAVFNSLQHAGDTDFDEFIEVAGGDGEELDPLAGWGWRGPAPLRERAG